MLNIDCTSRFKILNTFIYKKVFEDLILLLGKCHHHPQTCDFDHQVVHWGFIRTLIGQWLDDIVNCFLPMQELFCSHYDMLRIDVPNMKGKHCKPC